MGSATAEQAVAFKPHARLSHPQKDDLEGYAKGRQVQAALGGEAPQVTRHPSTAKRANKATTTAALVVLSPATTGRYVDAGSTHAVLYGHRPTNIVPSRIGVHAAEAVRPCNATHTAQSHAQTTRSPTTKAGATEVYAQGT